MTKEIAKPSEIRDWDVDEHHATNLCSMSFGDREVSEWWLAALTERKRLADIITPKLGPPPRPEWKSNEQKETYMVLTSRNVWVAVSYLSEDRWIEWRDFLVFEEDILWHLGPIPEINIQA